MTGGAFTLRVYRFDPTVDREARWESFTVPLLAQMTALDALFHVQNEIDGTLAFRCSCRVGMCGSCGMTIDGVPALACQTPLESGGPMGRRGGRGREPAPPTPPGRSPGRSPGSLSATGGTLFEVTVAPMRHMPVVRDLVVDMAPFFDAYERVIPYLVAKDPEAAPMVVPEGSDLRGRIDAQLECITCGLCYSGCAMVGANHAYLGPAALNRAYTLIADPRDARRADRLAVVDQAAGLWSCRTQLTCTEHCPKHISPTAAISELKGLAVRTRLAKALRWWSEDE